MEKTIRKAVLILVVIVLMIAFLTGCSKNEDSEKKYSKENEITNQSIVNTNDDSSKQGSSNNVSNQTDIALKDASKEIVYSYVDEYEERKGNAPNGNTYTISYKYKIPQINISSVAAEAINSSILNKYEKIYKEYKENGDSGCSRIEYKYYINNDVLSVEVAAHWDGGSIERSAYNINTKNGTEVTNTDLLKQRSITEAEFPNKFSSMLTELLKGMYAPSAEMTYPDTVEFFNTQYRKTTDTKNCTTGNDMFLNKNNELCVIVERFNIAGPDSTQIIVNIDKKIIEDSTES